MEQQEKKETSHNPQYHEAPPTPSGEKRPGNYWEYLKLDKLLNIQNGNMENDDQVSADEMNFIIVHQVFELWFKSIMKEIRLCRDKISAPFVPEEMVPFVVHHLRRVSEIFRVASVHWKVIETLIPQDFLEFRLGLGTASGFQSFQMRELETIFGLAPEERMKHGHGDPLEILRKSATESEFGKTVKERLDKIQNELSLRTAIHNWLFRTPINGSMPDDPNDDRVIDNWIAEYLNKQQKHSEEHIQILLKHGLNEESSLRQKFSIGIKAATDFLDVVDITDESTKKRTRRIRAAVLFIESYRSLPLLAWPRLLLDTVAELEEEMILFRTHHARMVERVIGRRVGTGGSSGVDYLDTTTKYRIFPELWVVRTLLLPVRLLPELHTGDVYKFANQIENSIKK